MGSAGNIGGPTGGRPPYEVGASAPSAEPPPSAPHPSADDIARTQSFVKDLDRLITLLASGEQVSLEQIQKLLIGNPDPSSLDNHTIGLWDLLKRFEGYKKESQLKEVVDTWLSICKGEITDPAELTSKLTKMINTLERLVLQPE